MDKYGDLVRILREQVVPAMGCTEPIAVALAGAVCRRYNPGERIHRIKVMVSENVFKNGMGVGIPGAGGRKGLDMAVALGVVGGDPDAGLEVLRDINSRDLRLAERMITEEKIHVNFKPRERGVYVEVILVTEKGNSRVVIRGEHSRIVYIGYNGQVIKDEMQYSQEDLMGTGIGAYSFDDFLDMVQNIPLEEIEFIAEGIKMNRTVAEAGLKEKLGMGLCHGLIELMKDGVIKDDLFFRVKIFTTAAADARMSGAMLPVMSSAGSGNHGITAILPVAVAGEYLHKSREDIIRAVTLSHLITNYIKHYTGRLSAICGCTVAAGSGAAAGIARLLGCNRYQIAGAIKNIIGNLSGMICDGAKDGCSLKLGVSGGQAVLAAQLARHNYIISASDGIVGLTVEETVRNLGEVADPGMINTDSIILNVILKKDRQCYANRH